MSWEEEEKGSKDWAEEIWTLGGVIYCDNTKILCNCTQILCTGVIKGVDDWSEESKGTKNWVEE